MILCFHISAGFGQADGFFKQRDGFLVFFGPVHGISVAHVIIQQHIAGHFIFYFFIVHQDFRQGVRELGFGIQLFHLYTYLSARIGGSDVEAVGKVEREEG